MLFFAKIMIIIITSDCCSSSEVKLRNSHCTSAALSSLVYFPSLPSCFASRKIYVLESLWEHRKLGMDYSSLHCPRHIIWSSGNSFLQHSPIAALQCSQRGHGDTRYSQMICDVNKCSIKNNLFFPTLPLSQKSKSVLGFSIWGNLSRVQWKSKPIKASDLIKDVKSCFIVLNNVLQDSWLTQKHGTNCRCIFSLQYQLTAWLQAVSSRDNSTGKPGDTLRHLRHFPPVD